MEIESSCGDGGTKEYKIKLRYLLVKIESSCGDGGTREYKIKILVSSCGDRVFLWRQWY